MVEHFFMSKKLKDLYIKVITQLSYYTIDNPTTIIITKVTIFSMSKLSLKLHLYLCEKLKLNSWSFALKLKMKAE